MTLGVQRRPNVLCHRAGRSIVDTSPGRIQAMCIILCMSTVVSSTEMHRSTGEILERVAAGEELVIERNGVPIARLEPVSSGPAALIGAGAGRTRQLVSDDELLAPVIEEM